MKPTIYPEKLTLYALHFEEPIGKSQHYTGSTRSPLLMRRMREHAQGKGSALTREAHKRNIGFWLVRCEPITSRADEYKKKANQWGKRRCPICTAPFDDPAKTPENGWFSPIQPALHVEGNQFPSRRSVK